MPAIVEPVRGAAVRGAAVRDAAVRGAAVRRAAVLADAGVLAETAVLAEGKWRALEASHQARADALTAGRRDRVQRGLKHPVDDFLYTYYPYKPSALRRWHPGAAVTLLGAEERAEWRWYRMFGEGGADAVVDASAYLEARSASVNFIAGLLTSTRERTARFGCFGLHEWAMVYRQGEHRHEAPLRLGQDGTDAVVDAHNIACTHFDAFRFFTPDAVALNTLGPSRENQPRMEQSGCLHAGMDVYKWAIKLGPLVPGELLLDCFELARDIRWLDMQASPYDVSAWGADAVAIETVEGKAEYVRRQRGFADRGDALRLRVVAAIDAARVAAGSLTPTALRLA